MPDFNRTTGETMKRVRIVGLCITAVLAISAVAAGSAAAAEPEYLTCAKAAKVGKTYTGKYTDKHCAEVNAKGEGKYERTALKGPDKFKSKSGATNLYLYEPATHTLKLKVVCKKDKDEGEIFNSREAKLRITYEECEPQETVLTGKCTTNGQTKAGTVVTEPLISKLVWVNEAETEPGVDVQAETPGGPIEKMVCVGAENAELLGSMVGKIGPVNSASKTQTLTFNASATTGEPEFFGTWEGAAFSPGTLTAELAGVANYKGVPVGLSSIEPQTGKEVIVSS
jgi:hypothetical protein